MTVITFLLKQLLFLIFFNLNIFFFKEIRDELSSTADIIRNAVGIYPRYMRPPYGDHDYNVVDIAHELGQEVVNWNIGNYY